MIESMSESREPVASPCMSICALDSDDVCIGCYRTGMEISHWGKMSLNDRHEVIRRCAGRMRGEDHACLVRG